ncbi:MAG TPA: glycosyltransferase family 4 protein [Pseudomonadales bacterium]
MLLTYSLLVVFATAFVATGLWLSLARHCRWFDHPNHRSSHVIPTPKSGGAGFVLAFSILVAALYLGDVIAVQQLALAGLALVLAGVGFIDDLRPLGIAQRIGTQVLTALGALLLLDPVPPLSFPWGTLEPAWLRIALLLPGLVWLVNLYNFMDGIDGLAATEAIFVCLALALFASVDAASLVTMLSLGLALAVTGFLFFNLPPAKLFMGDLGSNYLGFMLAVLGGLAMQSTSVNVWTLLVLLGVFIVDATVTLVGRMRAGLVWYHAHRSHAYQQAALRMGNHGSVVAAVAVINVCWLLPLAWLTTRYEQWGMLLVFIAWAPLHVVGRTYRQVPTVAVQE